MVSQGSEGGGEHSAGALGQEGTDVGEKGEKRLDLSEKKEQL